MNDPATNTEPTTPAIPPKPRRARQAVKRRATPPSGDPPAPKRSEFAGVTVTKCCDACTAERCIISTVDTCKHPFKTGDSGCGPVTLKNRDIVKQIVKRQKLD